MLIQPRAHTGEVPRQELMHPLDRTFGAAQAVRRYPCTVVDLGYPSARHLCAGKALSFQASGFRANSLNYATTLVETLQPTLTNRPTP